MKDLNKKSKILGKQRYKSSLAYPFHQYFTESVLVTLCFPFHSNHRYKRKYPFLTPSIALTRLHRWVHFRSTHLHSPTEVIASVFPNRSPQKQFPKFAALGGLKTYLDSCLWKATQICSVRMAAHFARVPLLYLSFTLLSCIF